MIPDRYLESDHMSLRRILLRMFPAAEIRIEPAAGGFVVGLVAEAFGKASPGHEGVRRILEEVEKVNRHTSKPEDRIVIFGCHFYESPKDVFEIGAVLRTRADTWERGSVVFHSSSTDAYVLADAIEAEAFLTDPGSRTSCRIVPDPAYPGGDDLLSHVRYAQFDLGGANIPVEKIEPEDKTSGIWVVHFSRL